MVIGIPKEIKNNEYRVALVPAGAEQLAEEGHTVLVESGAGLGTGIEDKEYTDAGGTILPSAREIFTRADMVVKVKEPLENEYGMLRSGKTVFTNFHLAASE